MNKIVLSAIAMIALTATAIQADDIDDVMQSNSSKQSTDDSQASSHRSSHHNHAEADKAQLEEFASVNSDQLAKEIAAGNGEMVYTLATLLKVENKALFVSKLQKNYANIYTSSDMKASEILNNISKI